MNIINIIDTRFYELLFKLINMQTTKIMMFISWLGSATILITIAVLSFYILKNKKNSLYISINLISVFLLNRILKYIIARPRPNVLPIVTEKGFSFPSGHAMVALGFYGFLIYLIFKNMKNKMIRNILIISLSILIFLIGISRIYLGVHYTTDILGAYLIGLIYMFLFIKYIYIKREGDKK